VVAADARRVLWQRRDVPGLEWCELSVGSDASRLRGTLVLARDAVPLMISYTIELDDGGRTRRVRISADGAAPVDIALEADGAGRWLRDGLVVVDSPDALDLDLSFSPATNTLPIRRLGLAVGESREIGVAWVLYPSFEIEYGRQTYERLGDRRWRYRSTGFEAELTVDEDGLVESYADWQAIARS
jgi:hypothetical protein